MNYNPEKYLYHPSEEFLEMIDNARFNKYIMHTNESIKYDKLIKKYDELIKKIAKCIYDLSLSNNSISSSFITNCFARSGIVSINNCFSITNPDDEFAIRLGFNIVLGNGVCRNMTYFHKDIFKCNNMRSDVFSCNTNVKNDANHIINIIEYQGILYGYDMINNKLLNFIDKYNLREFDRPKMIKYTPYGDMILLSLDKEDIIKRLTEYEKSSTKDSITKDEYEKIIENTEEKLKDNFLLVSRFKEEIKEDKAKIKELVNHN